MRPLLVIQRRAERASLKIKSYALTHSRQRGAKLLNPFAHAASIQPVIAVGIAILASSHTSHSPIRLCARQSRRTKLREFLMLDVLKDGHWAIRAGRSEVDSPCLPAFWRQWRVFDTKICLQT